MTRMRSQSPISSGASDEAISTDVPAARELTDQAVDVELRGDVDAARRLVEEEHHRLAGKGAGEDDLLLIAAAQLAAALAGTAGAQTHLAAAGGGKRPLAPSRQEGAGETEAAKMRQRDVLADRPRQEETLRAPLARDVGKAGSPGRCRVPGGRRPPGQADAPAARALGPDQEAQELALPRPGESREPDDLSPLQREAHPLDPCCR